MNHPLRVALVICTIGRPDTLERLFRSLAEQTCPPSEVLVVDQSGGDGTAAVVDAWRDRLPLRRLVTPRGLSAGRNAGLAALGDHDVVGFPDDDTWYRPGTIAAVRAAFSAALTTPFTIASTTAMSEGRGTGAVSGRLLDAADRPAQLSFGSEPAVLDEVTVWSKAIEAACFYSAAFLREIGGFDERLGAGCPTPWQSGEGTDLLLRGLRAGWTIRFDPRVVVHEDNPYAPAAGTGAFRVAARHVARGTGRVYRRHHGWRRRLAVVCRPAGGAVLAAARGHWPEAGWHVQRLVGRLEGLTGVVLPVRRHRYDTAAEDRSGV